MATPNMNLNLPTVTVTLGPAWATQVNAAMEVVDAHDHTSGKGLQIPTAGLNINADLDFNENAGLNFKLLNMENRTTTPSGSEFANATSVLNGDLYFTNASGVAVQITTGGSLVSVPSGVQSFETRSVTSDLVISPADTYAYLIVDTTLSRNITLPLANSVTSGRFYIIKDINGLSITNNITVSAAGADTVDGQATQTLESNYGSWMIVGDGVSSWYIS